MGMEVIYADSLFILNLIIDYLLCLVSARVCGLYLKRLRYFLAALIGAAYSVLSLLPGFDFLSRGTMKLVSALGMCAVAYGKEQAWLRCSTVFLAVSAAFGGAVWAISAANGMSYFPGVYLPVSLKALVLSFAICYAVISLIFRKKLSSLERRRAEVELHFLGKRACFTALYDSGNSLSDPVSGARVMVVSRRALADVLSPLPSSDAVELLQLANEVPELAGKFRLVSYRALGTEGIIAVFRPEALTIDGKAEKELLVGISQEALGDDFEAVI